ncbi:MAG TPA: hypothetical protein PKD00_06115 [Burkholderiales bacterium]|nr:hypothetical protein [Burkholderiales bacterium]
MVTLDIDNLSFFDEDIEEVIEDQKVEDNQKEEIPKVIEKPEEDEEEEQEEEEEVNVFSAIVQGLNKKGVTTLPEDVEYDEDTFLSAIFEEAKENVKAELGLDDERTQAMFKFVSSGGDLSKLADFYKNNAPGSFDLDSEEDCESLVIEEYTAKGLSPRRIATLVQGLKDDGELEDEARSIQTKREENFSKKEAQFIKQQEEAEKRRQEEEKTYKKSFDTVLNTGKEFFGFEVNEIQRKKLKDWLNVPVDYKHTDGKTYKLTKAQIKQLELQSDPKKHAEFNLAVQILLMGEVDKQTKPKKTESAITKDIWSKVNQTGKSSKRTTKESIDDVQF